MTSPIFSSSSRAMQAVSRAAAPPEAHPRWLAAVSLPCSDPVGLEVTGRSVRLYAGPHFHWRVNIYDSTNASCARWATASSVKRFVWTSHVPGYMTLFWKKVLVPSLTNTYDRIFILDNDVRLTPQLGFSAARIDRWFASTNAMIMQPSVIAADVGPGLRGGGLPASGGGLGLGQKLLGALGAFLAFGFASGGAGCLGGAC